MTKVKMLKSFQGSPDGIRVVAYAPGNEYDMPDSLARVAVSTKHAIYVAENTAPTSAPQNAAVASAPETKTMEAMQNAKKAKEAEKVEDTPKPGIVGRVFGKQK